jgi:AcrR family transcriptional regulator
MKAPERREREIARTREDILDAAARAFARTGMQATTMQDIAREAGYTAASLYTYFRSKGEIVEGLLQQLTNDFLQVFDQPIPEGLTFLQRFDTLMLRHLELIDKRRPLFVSLHTGQGGGPCGGDHGKRFHEAFELRVQRLAKWFDENARPDDIGGHDSETVARLLFGMSFGLFNRELASPIDGKRITDFAPVIREFFFYGVSGRPKAGAKKK